MADRRRSYVIVTGLSGTVADLSGTGVRWRPGAGGQSRPGTGRRWRPSAGGQSRPGTGRRWRWRSIRHQRRRGRHRLGTPGTTPRYPAGPPRPEQTGRRRDHRWRRSRPRHGIPAPARLTRAARCGGLVLLLGTLAASGWFTFSGAAAFAQMIQP